MEKKRPQLEPRKLRMGKLTSKGKHTVKVGNHPHTNMILKPVIVRGGEYKCRIFETHLKLRDQQPKTIMHIYRLLYQNHGNRKPKIYNRYTHKRKQSKHNTKDSHQITREQKRKGRKYLETNKIKNTTI